MSIAGVTGRVPVGAVLTIGTKGPSGAPTDRDRFYIKVPDSTEGERACHPSFGPYNTARCAGCVKDGKTDRNCPRCVSMRQTMRCVLVHASPADCFEWNRKAQKIMGGGFRNHPKLPACSGDGKRAKRLVMLSDGKAEYQDHHFELLLLLGFLPPPNQPVLLDRHSFLLPLLHRIRRLKQAMFHPIPP